MRVDIRDAEAVSAIRPVHAALYLRAGGWRQSSATAAHASVWERRVGDEEFEVLLP